MLRVAINVPLSREFDYLPPAEGPLPVPGSRVLVQFGPRRQVGIVLAHAASSDFPADKLRRCLEVLDDEAVVGEAELRLIRFTSDYYHHPIGEVVAAALPALLRQGKTLHPVVETISITDGGENTDVETLAKRAPKQAELLETLLDAGGSGLEADQLTEMLPNWRRVARALFEKGLIQRVELRSAEFDETLAPEAVPGPTLNEDQQQALATLRRSDAFGAYLVESSRAAARPRSICNACRTSLNRASRSSSSCPRSA